MEEENLLDDFGDDFEYSNQNCNPEDTEFDKIVEVLQEIVLEKEFENLQSEFLN